MIKVIVFKKVYTIRNSDISGGDEMIKKSVLISLPFLPLKYYPTIEHEILESFIINYPNSRIVYNDNTFKEGIVY